MDTDVHTTILSFADIVLERPDQSYWVLVLSDYGLQKTSVSGGCPHFAATNANSAASKKPSHSSQIRPPKFESQEESFRWVSHKAHSPRVFLSNGLIAKLILMFVVSNAYRL